jgi:hypothetical protein
MNKKIALISSFCDTNEKLDVLKKNISIVKSQGIDVLVISPFVIDKKITEMCDYFFITKDNPILDWPERSMFYWRILSNNNSSYKLSVTYADYGFAGLYQVKQLSDIALTFGYEQFFHMIYDIKITEDFKEFFNSDRKCSIFPSKRDNQIWPFGLHFMIFDRLNLEKFSSMITLKNYLSVENSDAFSWLEVYRKQLNSDIEKIPVEDEIFYYENKDFLNFSPFDSVKFFIEKNDEQDENVKLFFYDITDEIEVKIIIDNIKYTRKINNLDLIDLGYKKNEIKNTSIQIADTNKNITEIIKKIKHNTLQKL